jgi:hypothetical protein
VVCLTYIYAHRRSDVSILPPPPAAVDYDGPMELAGRMPSAFLLL